MGLTSTIKPQQLLVADALSTPAESYAVEIPRRASKTTTIFCLLLGRCSRRPGYQVTFSAQSGVASTRKFREWANTLDRVNPPSWDEVAPPWMKGRKPRTTRTGVPLFDLPGGEAVGPPTRGFRCLRGAANTRIEFDNGSSFIVLKPEAEAYRGEAADVSWLDEAQEIPPDTGTDLLAAILPLQDTKPGASVILSGTAGEARAGIFWDALEQLRRGEPGVGGVDFTAGDYDTAGTEAIDWALVEDEDSAIALLERTHPGVGTLTTTDAMRSRWRKLPRPQWAREYLSIWPLAAGAAAVPAEWWMRAALDTMKRKPKRVAFGLDIKPGGSSAAVVAAWRDSRGHAFLEVIDHRQGTQWIPERLQELTGRYAGSLVAYDDISEGKATATEAGQLRPRPRLKVQTYREHAAGCVQLLRELERGRVHHFNQAGLDAAAQAASKRTVKGEQGVWLWTAGPGADITPLVAGTRALRLWDQHLAGKTAEPRAIIVSG